MKCRGKRIKLGGGGLSHCVSYVAMRNLHAKFIRENAGLPVSVATFCRSRPRHIRLTHYTQRKVCQRHSNMALMVEATKVLPHSTATLVAMDDKEIRSKLDSLENTTISYYSGPLRKRKKIVPIKKWLDMNLTCTCK